MAKAYGDQNGRNPSNKGAATSRRAALESRTANTQPDWKRINMELLHAVIGVVTPDDGAIRFGYSRDGGAYAVGIYGDGEPYTTYYHSDDEITEFLQKIWEVYRAEG